MYLETEGVENFLIGSGYIQVQWREPQILQPCQQLRQLLGVPPREHLEVDMSFYDRHLNVGHGWPFHHINFVTAVVLVDVGDTILAPAAGTPIKGAGRVLWGVEEVGERRSEPISVCSLLELLLHLKRLQELLKFLNVIDCAPNDRCLITL